MKEHYGTKKILAKPMNRGDYNKYRGWEIPANENGAEEGYLVEYTDGGKANMARHEGYVSWSPKDVFDAAYKTSGAMNFGHVLIALKEGRKVSRSGWNGQGQFIYYVPANTYKTQTDAARSVFGEEVPYRAYLALKTVQNDVVPWLASMSDMLAEDWGIVE